MLCIIFDFDDTLFPTSFVEHCTLKTEPLILPSVSESINNTLNEALKITENVYIVTNAELDWLRLCLKYIPNCDILTNFISGSNVISTVYEIKKEEDGSLKYNRDSKNNIFLKIIKDVFKDKEEHHFLSLGDSPNDRLAALFVKENCPEIFVKHISFILTPTIKSLLLQHELFLKNLEWIIKIKTDLDLYFSDVLNYQRC